VSAALHWRSRLLRPNSTRGRAVEAADEKQFGRHMALLQLHFDSPRAILRRAVISCIRPEIRAWRREVSQAHHRSRATPCRWREVSRLTASEHERTFVLEQIKISTPARHPSCDPRESHDCGAYGGLARFKGDFAPNRSSTVSTEQAAAILKQSIPGTMASPPHHPHLRGGDNYYCGKRSRTRHLRVTTALPLGTC